MKIIQTTIGLLLYMVFVVCCGSRVNFLANVEEIDSPDLESDSTKNIQCLTIEGEGEVCVEQKEETIVIKDITNHPIDMIFVWDVSQSMQADLLRIGQAFDSLISQVEDTDWRIMFTTTYHGDHEFEEDLDTGAKIFTNENWRNYKGNKPYFGQLMYLKRKGNTLNTKVLSREILNYKEIFRDTLDIDPAKEFGCSEISCPIDMEQPLRSLMASFHRLAQRTRSPSEPKIRKDSDVVVFIATDEDERVEDPRNATRAESVIRTFQTLFSGQRLYAFAFLVQSTECYTQQLTQKTEVAYGKRVAALTNLTYGESFSICDPDYGSSMKTFSSSLRARLQRVRLKQEPFLPEKLEVEFLLDGSRPIDWIVVGNELIFKEPLPPEMALKITYFIKKQTISNI